MDRDVLTFERSHLQVTGDIPQNVNFALKAEVARTFLDSNGVAYRTARSEQQLAPADVADIGRPVTVLVECRLAHSQPAAAAEKRKSPSEKRIPPVQNPQSAAVPGAPPPSNRPKGNAPCEAFQKLPDGRWTVIRPVNIVNGTASITLNRGAYLSPGTLVTGVDIYAALERSCH